MIAPVSFDFEPVAPGVCTSCMGCPVAKVVMASLPEDDGAFPYLVVVGCQVEGRFTREEDARAYARDCNTCCECGKEVR